MRKTKSIVAMAMMTTLIGSLLTGCGQNSEATEKIVIDIYQSKVEINDALRDATKRYMELNPNVKINMETVGGGDDYEGSLRGKMSGSQQPDIFCAGGAQGLEVWSPYLEDLSNEPWVEYTVKEALDYVTYNGQVLAMPSVIEGYGFVYNKEIFKAAGIDAENLKTLDEIDEAFSKLKEMIDNGDLKEQYPNLEAVMEYPVKETWVTGMHTGNLGINQEFSSEAEAYSSKTLEFTYEKQLQDIIDMQVKYTSNASNPTVLNNVDYATSIGGGLAIERVAVVQQGNWISPEVSLVNEALVNNLGIIPIPVGDVSMGEIPVGVPTAWGINKESSDAEKEASKDFLNWLYQSEEGKEIIVNEFLFIPPFTNYDNIEPKDALGKVVKEYSDAGKTSPWVFSGAPNGWCLKLGEDIQAYVAGKVSWEDVVKNSKHKWELERSK